MSLCKYWKSIITNHSFIHYHLSYNIQSTDNNNDFFFLQYTSTKRLTCWNLEFEEVYSVYLDDKLLDHLTISKVRQSNHGLTMVGTCNGLVCFADYYSILSNDPTLIIMNPPIRKYVVLPKPVAALESKKQYNPDRAVLGFGFDSKSRDFKVLKIVFHHLERVALQVDAYSLTTGKWRNITHKVPSLCFKWRTNRQVIVNGALHWIVYGDPNNNGQVHDFILSFDLTKETFGELMLPKCLEYLISSVLSPFTKGNSLALAECSRLSNKIDVFVMKEYGVVSSWDLILSIDSSRYGGISSRVLGMTNNGDLVLQTLLDNNIILWDPKKDLWKELGLLEEECTVSFVGDHVESLVLINQENNVSFR
ncbi:hypothetical protein K1719_040260 [Acacia pycnantha]|nr:hypothetical protein K1719_040260 [Acacia pycnantha]